jgi:hypothetical protein
MSRGTRIFWIFTGIFAIFVVGSAGAVALAAHAVYNMPRIEVSVHEHGEDGTNISFAVPGAAVAAGLALAPHVVPGEELAEMRADLDAELADLPPEWRETTSQLIAELADMPDAVLVEVDDHRDHVRVEKRGEHLVITVRSDDADVDVTVPIALMDRVADFVAG